MSIEKQKLEDIRKQVRASTELKEPHKDTLDDMLRLTAEATNGAEDRVQAIAIGMASIAAAIARDTMYRNEDFRAMIDDALERHRQDCPLAQKWDGETERRGRDGLPGRDGRDSVSVGGKWGRLSVPAFLWVATMGWSLAMAVVAIIFKAKGWA